MPIILSGLLFGAVPGALVGFAADLIGCLFSPSATTPSLLPAAHPVRAVGGFAAPVCVAQTHRMAGGAGVFPAAALGSVLWQSMALALVYGGAARWPYFLTRLAARSVQFAVTGCIDTVLVWLLARRNALSPVLRRIKTKGSEHRDA